MNTNTRYLIIGGGIAGTNAAETIRQRDAAGEITILNEEPHRFYSRILLSKPSFFLEKIAPEKIFLRSEQWYVQQRITLRTGIQVTAINPAAKTVTTANGEAIGYDKLLVATGSCPPAWSVAGAATPGVFNVRTLHDVQQIMTRLKTTHQALVVGGGFIGFEMCDLLRQKNIPTTLIIREPFFWGLLWDEVSGQMVERALATAGVTILKNDEVVEVQGGSTVASVVTKQGTQLPADIIIVGIGVTCHQSMFDAAGLAVGRGLLTNEFLETNQPDIWAAGDVAEYHDIILDERVLLGNWTNAQMQGRAAGGNMCGPRQPFRFVSSYTTNGLGLSIAFVGDVRLIPGRDVLIRQPANGAWYSRILYEKDEIVGATMINRTTEVQPIAKLIAANVKVSSIADSLADPSVLLSALLPAA